MSSGCSTSFGIVDTTFLHICSDPAVRTPFGVYLVCVPSTLVSDRLYRSSYLPYQKQRYISSAQTKQHVARPFSTLGTATASTASHGMLSHAATRCAIALLLQDIILGSPVPCCATMMAAHFG